MNVIRELGWLLRIRRNDSKGVSMPFKRGRTSIQSLIQRSGWGRGRGGGFSKTFFMVELFKNFNFQIRLTGGEPLVRGGVVSIVERLAALPGLQVKTFFETFSCNPEKSAHAYVCHWCENVNQLFADDWDDNERSDPRQEVARLEEGWAHPPQHQPRHIGDDKAVKYLSFFNIWRWSNHFNLAETR